MKSGHRGFELLPYSPHSPRIESKESHVPCVFRDLQIALCIVSHKEPSRVGARLIFKVSSHHSESANMQKSFLTAGLTDTNTGIPSPLGTSPWAILPVPRCDRKRGSRMGVIRDTGLLPRVIGFCNDRRLPLPHNISPKKRPWTWLMLNPH